MSESPTAEPGPPVEPPVRRGRVVVVALVVATGLGLGGLAAVLVAGRDPSGPDDDRIRLALGTQFGLDAEATACVVAHLEETGALDRALATDLVDDALAGTSTSSPAVVDAITACSDAGVVEALVAAGVPEEVVPCAADTLADQPAAVLAAVVVDPLAVGSPGRSAVSACALEHLAAAVESGAAVTGVDARCVAADVIDRVGLETALASIGALAVTAEVAAAATEAAEACASS